MVILEALAAGLAIVSTRVGGVPEVAPEGDVAWYCEPGDAAAFAKILCQALGGGDLAARGARARQLARATYSIEAMQEKHEHLFRELLAAKRTS